MFLILFQGPTGAIAPTITKFRRTLSELGARVGVRQSIGMLLVLCLILSIKGG